ncbi:cytochrome P450 [Nocardioides sp.]|uniref:cytochrome P450 n=1 Tax=Nocardioides sp. TaxID=35761 RepID=UPI0035157EFB
MVVEVRDETQESGAKTGDPLAVGLHRGLRAAPSLVDPARWDGADVRPGVWLPFGAGHHACPGRSLGLAQLTALARWGLDRQVVLTQPARIDQTRGIFPSPALLRCGALPSSPEE